MRSTPKQKAACVAEIRPFLTTLPAAPLVVIKDPRITAAVRHVVRGGASGRIRHRGRDCGTPPAGGHGVACGACDAQRASPELSSALWLKYTLLAERHTRGLPRVFVEYANLLDDWRREVKRISAALAIDLNTRDEGAIEEFLGQDHRHQQHCGPMTEPFGTDWISTVYEALGAAARDEPWDGSALDRVFEAYRASEHGFRTALEDFHSRFNSRLFRLMPAVHPEEADLRGPRDGTPAPRDLGLDRPADAETMIGIQSLTSPQRCVETVLADDILGDLIECGV